MGRMQTKVAKGGRIMPRVKVEVREEAKKG
jgi:hypothetical protein